VTEGCRWRWSECCYWFTLLPSWVTRTAELSLTDIRSLSLFCSQPDSFSYYFIYCETAYNWYDCVCCETGVHFM